MSLLQHLQTIVRESFREAGFSGHGNVSESKRPDLCQFQSNDAFAIAKQEKMSPQLICEPVIAILNQHEAIEKAEFAPPGFINLTLTDAFLLQELQLLRDDVHFGVPQIGCGQTLVIDYGGPNVAKPLHVGHLRPAVIGEAIKRIARTLGFQVIGDVHLGDWGLPLGLVMKELQDRYPDWACFSESFTGTEDTSIELTPELLYEIYPFASAKSKEDETYLQEAREITARLQAGDPGYRVLWQKIVATSKADIQADYQKLNIEFDYWYGESDAEPYIPELMATLTAQHLLRESEGAQVVDVMTEADKAPIPPVIVEKRDGSSIYATTDLATIIQREKDFKPQALTYVVDKRQGLHFEQVFRVSRKAQLVPDTTTLTFVGFGTMNGPDGKPFKTRDGGLMSLKSLLQSVQEQSYEKLQANQNDPQTDDALKIGVAAIKFGDLMNHPTSDYAFDIEKFLSFEGKTGSYILYNNVRILGILEKLSGSDAYPVTQIASEYDRQLILKLLRNPEMLVQAYENNAPNVIAESTYQIAVSFAKFYTEHNIVSERDMELQRSWLGLLQLTHQILVFNLDALGIQTVAKM